MIGDPSPVGLDELLEQSERVRSLARSLLGREEDADDVVQDALAMALQRPPRGPGPKGGWFRRVARNLSLNLRRAQRRRSRREAEAARPEMLDAPDVLEKAEIHRELIQALMDLGEPYRTVLLLHYFEGKSVRHVARARGMQESAVRTLLSRGRARLREALEARHGRDGLRALLLALVADWPHAPPALLAPPLSQWLRIAALFLLIAGGGATAWTLWSARGDDAGVTAVQGAVSATAILDAGEQPAAITTSTRARETLPGVDSVDPERDLRGVVVTTAGDAIAGARLTVVLPLDRQVPGMLDSDQHEERAVAEAVSAPDGSFRFRLEPGKVYDLSAEARGFAFTRLPGLYAGEELTVAMAQAASVYGRITDARSGAPIAGATVEAWKAPIWVPGDHRAAAVSDAGGFFHLQALRPDLFTLKVDAAGYAKDWGSQSILLAEGEQRRMDLTLDPGTSIRGRVADGRTGAAIAGALVRLRTGGAHNVAGTDDEGRYVLRGVPAGYDDNMVVEARGYGQFSFRVYKVPETGLDQDVLLQPGRRAHGRVVNRDGVAVAGAYVTAGAYALRDGDSHADARRARTGADGRFELADLRGDLRHTLMVHAGGLATTVHDFPADEWATLDLDLGEIVLERPAAISGRLVNPQGRPLPDLWVLLSGEPRRRDELGPALEGNQGYVTQEGLGFGRILARTDARGRFAFGALPSGSYILDAGSKGFARRAELELQLEEGEQRTGVELALDVGLVIDGVVVDRQGRPLPSATVEVYPSEQPLHRQAYNLAGADGRFRLSGLEPGSYTLCATRGFGHSYDADGGRRLFGAARLAGIAAGAHDVMLVLPDAAAISGTVLGPDGQPLVGASVLLLLEEQPGSMRMMCSTDRDGRFAVAAAEGSRVSLVFHPPYGPIGGYLPVLDASGQWDPSYDVTLENVAAGTEGLVVRLTRLP
ncbi:MAG: sigma-70 family RNA polymerase sigma factor [Planctomycetota bacterium]|nr:MAG: sigma-70 family RNA polymerase sigma factor [Planctomycetota bacterium]